jgi:hypothetical protein
MTPAAPPSPCIGICELDPRTDTCRGCRRTRAEIAAWSTATPAEQRAIIRRVEQRQRGALAER